MSMKDNDELRERIRILEARNAKLKEKINTMRRQLGGTQAALSRAQQKIKELKS